MAEKKTTVYLDAVEYRKLQQLARQEGRSAAELIREAVLEYNARRGSSVRPRSLGAGRSRDGSLSERTEELLQGFGEAG